jgi:tetratricopeptide (TPR) repeat protein
MKQDAELLTEVGRLLSRAFENNKQDYDVVLTLGNTHFDIGYFKKDNAQFERARQFYSIALQQKPSDVDARTDLGLTYFLADPPDNEKAINEFQKSLQSNPKHEKTLQVITQALLNQSNISEAEKYLAKLKDVNPNNQYLSELESNLAQVKGSTAK